MGWSACCRQLPPSPRPLPSSPLLSSFTFSFLLCIVQAVRSKPYLTTSFALFYRNSSCSLLPAMMPFPSTQPSNPICRHRRCNRTPVSLYTTRQATFLCYSAYSVSLVDPIFNTSSAFYAYPAANIVHHEFLGG
jgi:hypothetical protein